MLESAVGRRTVGSSITGSHYLSIHEFRSTDREQPFDSLLTATPPLKGQNKDLGAYSSTSCSRPDALFILFFQGRRQITINFRRNETRIFCSRYKRAALRLETLKALNTLPVYPRKDRVP